MEELAKQHEEAEKVLLDQQELELTEMASFRRRRQVSRFSWSTCRPFIYTLSPLHWIRHCYFSALKAIRPSCWRV